MNKIHIALTILAAAIMNRCDSNALETKALTNDGRSGKRARDLASGDIVTQPAPAEASPEFKILLQGTLPETGSGPGEYELYVVNPEAATYRFALLDEGSDCKFDETVYSLPTSTPISFEVHEQKGYVLCIKGYTVTGSESRLFSHRWTLEPKKPDLTVFNVPNENSGQTRLNFTVLSEKASAYKYAFNDGEKACSSEKYSDEQAISESISIEVGSPGKKQICVKAVDANGAESEIFEKTWVFSDQIPSMFLTGLPTPVTILSSTKITLDLTSSKISSYQYVILQGESDCSTAGLGALTEIATPITSNLGVPGLNTLCLKGQDANSNSTGMFSYSWILDVVRQNLVIADLPQIEDPMATLAVKITGSSIKDYKYALMHSDDIKCGNIKYSNFQPVDVRIQDKLELGGYTICIIARDSKDKASTPGRYTWSRIKMPDASVQAISGMPSALTSATIFKNIVVSGLNAETYRSGFSKGNIECDQVALSNPVAISLPFDLNIGNDAIDGDYTVCVAGIGHFKQQSIPAKKYLFSLDRTKPPSIALSGLPASISPTMAISINVTSPTATEYVFVRKAGSDGCKASAESTERFPIAQPLMDTAGEGSQTLCVWTYDSANNVSAPQSVQWTVDTIPPQQNEIVVVNSDLLADKLSFQVSIAAPEISASYRYDLMNYTTSAAVPAPPCPAISTPGAYPKMVPNISTATVISKPQLGTMSRICVFVTDAALNNSEVKSADIGPKAVVPPDTTAPIQGDLAVANDPNSVDVSLHVSITIPEATATYKYSLVDYQDTTVPSCPNTADAAYEFTLAISVDASIAKPNSGMREICAFVLDEVGNKSNVKFISIGPKGP